MQKLSEYEALALNKLGQTIQDGKWSNEGLVQLIKLSGEYLNIQTRSDYCERTGKSYQAVKKDTKTRKNIEIFNVKFIIDND